jgi:HEAT repeat protein
MLVAALVRRGTTHKRPASVRLPSEAPATGGPANLQVVRSSDPRAKTAIAKATIDAAQAAVARLVADPNADPAQAAESLRSASPVNEVRMLAILTNSRPPEKIAAARLLGEIGGPGAVPDLLRASADPSLHVATIGALSRIADSATINQLVREETSKDLQRILLSALLGRGDGEAVSLYLSYVVNGSTTETALTAAESVQNPPMDLLFSELQSPSELERLAAARVLGRIDGPATTERLIAMLEEGSSRQEACVALLSSRGPDAANFVKSARTNPALSTLLHAASLLASNNSQPRS